MVKHTQTYWSAVAEELFEFDYFAWLAFKGLTLCRSQDSTVKLSIVDATPLQQLNRYLSTLTVKIYNALFYRTSSNGCSSAYVYFWVDNLSCYIHQKLHEPKPPKQLPKRVLHNNCSKKFDKFPVKNLYYQTLFDNKKPFLLSKVLNIDLFWASSLTQMFSRHITLT